VVQLKQLHLIIAEPALECDRGCKQAGDDQG